MSAPSASGLPRGDGALPASEAGAFGVPPLALGAALLLWAVRADALVPGVVFAVVVELARLVPWRWDLGARDFNRVADLTGLGFVALVVYQFDAHSVRGIYEVLRWLPAVLVLITAVQVYSTADRVPYTALFLSVRRAVARGAVPDPGTVDMRKPFLLVCLVSAGSGSMDDRALYLPAVALIVAYVVWSARPRRAGGWTTAAALAVAIALGFAGIQGVMAARRAIEPFIMELVQDRIWNYRDPYRAYTAMGQIGRLKLSERIVLRVTPAIGVPPPGLLREATFHNFNTRLWLATQTEFAALEPNAEGTAWRIGATPPSQRHAMIAAYLPRGRGLLAVPNGTFQVEELPVEDLLRNRLGVLKVLQGPEVVEYRARYHPDASYDPPPVDSDRQIPERLRGLLADLSTSLGLDAARASDSAARLQSYFDREFRYTLELTGPDDDTSPLEDFLLRSRAGHCEYFATATVLLLRAAGIPARYATGYSVQEWSELEQAFVVRRRHAHAWALAWIDGQWRDVDTTPAVWLDLESAGTPWWLSGYDLLSWLRHGWVRWRWTETAEGANALLLLALVPLVLALAWRLSRRRRVRRDAAPGRAAAPARVAGADSELLAVVAALQARGLAREPGEPLGGWLGRLSAAGALPEASLVLDVLLPLHRRYRHDPGGLDDAERTRLRTLAAQWIARHGTSG
ncbi:MAG: transglutaminase domain-containing protein [Ectothiorhodospiraceae bacterium]|nr:transglutaminase domain-containing protein [Chromatiales bacterium]MCP5153818.1 transglutaminase domain-containing protein [Ectothiorhodospiraceae bacterium]